jgi:hypothetical protein
VIPGALSARTDVREITKDTTINFETEGTDVLGYSVECPANSTTDATVQINGSPSLPLGVGDPARGFGDNMGSVPVLMKDEIKISFTAPLGASPRVLVVIKRIQC